MFSFLNDPLKAILLGIYSFVGNYGWSIVVFTLLIRIILMPLDAKSRKSMRKTQKLQPQIALLQKKYKNDKDKLNQKTMELYKKEKVSPLSGCLPMLISLPILFGMFGAMNMLAHEQIAGHVFTYLQNKEPAYQGWLWVKNIWMPDSPFAPVVPDENSIKQVAPENWQAAYNRLDETQRAAIDTMNAGLSDSFKISFDFSTKDTTTNTVNQMLAALEGVKKDAKGNVIETLPTPPIPLYAEKTAKVPSMSNISLILVTLSVFVFYNGFFILPLLAAGSQFLMSSAMPQTPVQDGKPNSSANFMKYFFPIFSLFICFSSNAGFALYWVTANLIAAAQNLLLNKYFDAQERKAAAVGEGTVK